MDQLSQAYGIRQCGGRARVGWSSNEICRVSIPEHKYVLGGVHANPGDFGERTASILQMGVRMESAPFDLCAGPLVFDRQGRLILALTECRFSRNSEVRVFDVSELHLPLSSKIRFRMTLLSGNEGVLWGTFAALIA